MGFFPINLTLPRAHESRRQTADGNRQTADDRQRQWADGRGQTTAVHLVQTPYEVLSPMGAAAEALRLASQTVTLSRPLLRLPNNAIFPSARPPDDRPTLPSKLRQTRGGRRTRRLE